MRDVLVHYHLFKNAGSSIDRCLKDSFGDAWLAFDPESPSGLYTSKELDDIISQHAEAIAFSSHCIVPPLSGEVACVHPIVVLREPISRVMSAYLFEWKKQKNLEVVCGPLTDYIQQKFDLPRMNAIENFQTIRLSVTDSASNRPSSDASDDELVHSACRLVDELPAFGLVERFEESVRWLQRTYSPTFPRLDLQPVSANVLQKNEDSLADRYQKIEDQIGSELFEELILRNQMDIRLYAYALGRFNVLNEVKAMDCDQPLMLVRFSG